MNHEYLLKQRVLLVQFDGLSREQLISSGSGQPLSDKGFDDAGFDTLDAYRMT